MTIVIVTSMNMQAHHYILHMRDRPNLFTALAAKHKMTENQKMYDAREILHKTLQKKINITHIYIEFSWYALHNFLLMTNGNIMIKLLLLYYLSGKLKYCGCLILLFLYFQRNM